jgi:hypothetical protein
VTSLQTRTLLTAEAFWQAPDVSGGAVGQVGEGDDVVVAGRAPLNVGARVEGLVVVELVGLRLLHASSLISASNT